MIVKVGLFLLFKSSFFLNNLYIYIYIYIYLNYFDVRISKINFKK
jgi:hypothetical protein